MEVVDKSSLEEVKTTASTVPKPKKGTTPKTVDMLASIALGLVTIFFEHSLMIE